MHEINEPQPISCTKLRWKGGGSINDPQAPQGGKAMTNIPLVISEAISEALEETRGSTKSHKCRSHQLAN
uniref:Uncharacterized protein n=1 Tax=Cajanus cajan TaxID=3821 RepID=A0A151RHL3_CAJCA|nr:hypothetical protein KK1_036570 [Cajanus cajan]